MKPLKIELTECSFIESDEEEKEVTHLNKEVMLNLQTEDLNQYTSEEDLPSDESDGSVDVENFLSAMKRN